MNYKIMVDNFVIDKYDELVGVSKYYCMGSNLPSNDLVNELIEYLYNNESKVSSYINSSTSLIRFSKVWMWNQVNLYTKNGGNSNFKSKFQILNSLDSDTQIDSNKLSYNISLDDEYEEDLRRVYSDEQVRKIIFTRSLLTKLNEAEKKLFKLHYDDNMSHSQIAKYYEQKWCQKCSPSSIYNLIVALRDKIKKEWDIYESRN